MEVAVLIWLTWGVVEGDITLSCCYTYQLSSTPISQVWDVTTAVCDQTLTHHTGKVQAVAWNAAQASVLLSGGFDQAACMVRMLMRTWDLEMTLF